MTEEGKPEFFYGYVIVAAAFIVMAVAMGGNISFGVFFKPVLVEFGWTRATTSGAFSLSVILSGFLGLVAGRLNDRFGPRLVLTACGILSGLGYLLLSQVSGLGQLYLVYGLIMGIGLSGYFVALLSTTARWFVKRRGMMTGIVLAGIGTGTTVMPLLASWLISNYEWRTSYIIVGIISLILIVLIAQLFQRDPQSRGQLPDGGMEEKHNNLNSAAEGLSFQEALRTKQLWMLPVIFLGVGFSIYAMVVHIVIHATGLGILETSAVNILALAGGANIVARLMIGNVVDRIGSRPALIIGLSAMLTALVWLQFANELWMLYLFGAIFGFAWGGSSVPMSPIIAELFGLKAHGVLFGFVDIGFAVGATIAPVLIGYIFDVTSSYQLGFLICAVLSAIGLILALLLKPTRAISSS